VDIVKFAVTRRQTLMFLGAQMGSSLWPAQADESSDIAIQPYFADVNRALDALAKLGAPVADSDAQRIAALTRQGDTAALAATEKILERYTVARLTIGTDGTGRVAFGGTQRLLVEQGWRMFLVRIENRSARDDSVLFASETGTPGDMETDGRPWHMAQRAYLDDRLYKGPLIEKMWITSELYDSTPVIRWGTEVHAIPLSGIPVEYRVVQIFSRDAGRRVADFGLYVLPKSGVDSGKSSHQQFDFECLPSRTVTLSVIDVDGRGCMASFIIKDKFNRIYPPQAMRIAPDMYFHAQIYRGDGETVRLPDGEYNIESKRGPEYLSHVENVIIDAEHTRIGVKLERWIDPSKWGWYSGDTHIHAAGCAHYQIPTEGVSPETMIRHMRGEALTIGDALNWSPSWYYQKQFFSAHTQSPPANLEHSELQQANSVSLQPTPTPEDSESILRYDVEVSGFPSSHAGHLVLLRLKEQDYPGTKLIEDWPSWNLPILQWAKSQGAVAGYAHCGWGMVVDSTDLPNYEIPPMDGNGTQEAIVDVTHGYVDFLSGCDGLAVAELNAWYHMLNCGFRMAMIGETDFPCATGERVGVGRSYVRLDHRPVNDAGYEAWVQGLKEGKLYCGDGRSHFLDVKVQGRRSGERDVALHAAQTVTVVALVAARLEPMPTPDTESIRTSPYIWNIEKARIGTSREVPVELLVNGQPADQTTLYADGTPRTIEFKVPVHRSSWVALRILPSAHTHPVFVTVADKPIRASKRSARWCRTCVDKVWEVKSPFMREGERPAAAEAFDHARNVYEKIMAECEIE